MPKLPDDPSPTPGDDTTAPEEVDARVDGESFSADAVPETDGPAPPADGALAEDSPFADPLTDVALESELTAARERALRLQAELENYRKRAQRTLQEERRYAGLPLMRDLLAVVDNLQRAIDAAQQNDEGSTAGLLEGVQMVAEQLATILKQHHCEEIPASGARFDPHMHEAIAQFPCEDCEPGHVAQVTQVGYQLHDRVIRPAQVIVAAAKPEDNTCGNE